MSSKIFTFFGIFYFSFNLHEIRTLLLYWRGDAGAAKRGVGALPPHKKKFPSPGEGSGVWEGTVPIYSVNAITVRILFKINNFQLQFFTEINCKKMSKIFQSP